MNKSKESQIIISVILPVYNEERYIAECIKSINNQSFKRYEVIVVDDGSSDLTPKIVKKTNARLILTKHRGPGHAKNIAIKRAKGKIIVFIDADMIIDKDYLKNLVEPIINRKAIATYTTSEYILNSNNIWSKCWNINFSLPINLRLNIHDKTQGLVSRAILKDELLKINCFDEKLGYIDDRSVGMKGIVSKQVNNAICFHNNPDALIEVYYSARWIGRSPEISRSIRNLVRYSIFNSIRNGLKKVFHGSPLIYILFKIVFDFGIISGIIFKNKHENFAK